MYFWQILLRIKRAAILQWMHKKASNFQVSTHFAVGFRNWYPYHYWYFFLHLIKLTYVWISNLKWQVGRLKLWQECSVFLRIPIHEKPLFLINEKHSAFSFTFFKKKKKRKKKKKKHHQNKWIFKEISKSCYFLLGSCRNVNFGLF